MRDALFFVEIAPNPQNIESQIRAVHRGQIPGRNIAHAVVARFESQGAGGSSQGPGKVFWAFFE